MGAVKFSEFLQRVWDREKVIIKCSWGEKFEKMQCAYPNDNFATSNKKMKNKYQ